IKECCETCYKNVAETCYKDVVKTVCRPVTTCKTVKKCVRVCSTETYCKPGKKHHCWQETCGEGCFDPCTCKSCYKPGKKVRVTCKEPDQVCTRQVWKKQTVCEQVPCTTYVKECVHCKVPYTVCRKVPYTVVKKVPVTCTRMVTEHCVKKVPYTCCHMETQIIKKQIPYTVSRTLCGAYVDAAGKGYDCAGPGREFKEGAQVCVEVPYTTCRMVQEQHVKQVPYTVCRTVTQDCVKKVPYQVCRM